MRVDGGVHDPFVQAGFPGAATQDESEVVEGFGEQVRRWNRPSPFITNNIVVTSTAGSATSTTIATRARIAAAAARARSRSELMMSAATSEVSIALCPQSARNCASDRVFFLLDQIAACLKELEHEYVTAVGELKFLPAVSERARVQPNKMAACKTRRGQ
ncbi:hypothetical protein OIE71_34330 [Streptomyces sp. NBC_01725]|uniref:hypothetical protein n=1 Tax=Streptomyces sp. NBC_01725 TaxID=2975923 RepID=UPI002E28D318|nr:hypothetical protein [Streptomyces sp. NBC_01725]